MNVIEKVKGLTNKKKYIISGVSVLIVGSIGVGYVYADHNKQVQIEQQEAKEKAYDQLIKDAESKISKAYETRKKEDIDKANKAAEKLNKTDKKSYQAKITKLQGFLDQIAATTNLIAAAEKSKNQVDVDKAQKAIDAETDKYLVKDKKAHQERINKVKAAITAKEEQEKKAAEEKKKTEQQQANKAEAPKQQEQGDSQAASPADDNTTVAEGNGSNNANYGSVDNGAGQENYQAPAQGNYTPQAPPAQAGTPNQPAAPSTNNGGQQGGSQQPATPSVPTTPTPDYEPAGRVSPWFMTASEAYAWAEANLNDNDYNRARVEGTSFSDGTIRSCVVLG